MVKNKSLVSIVPPQGNLAMERVRLVIKCHLVREKKKKEKNHLYLHCADLERKTEYRNT